MIQIASLQTFTAIAFLFRFFMFFLRSPDAVYMVRSLSLFVVVLDAELLLHLPVVKDAEDVLARTVDGAAQQEVGEAEVVILLGQQVITVLKQTRPVLKVLYIC